MYKKIIILSLVFFFVFYKSTHAVTECSKEKGYYLYQCRVEHICDIYIKEIKPIYQSTKYLNLESVDDTPHNIFETTKTDYRNNMNNLYKCGILQIQKKSLKIISTVINTDRTGEIKQNVERKITNHIHRIDKTAANIGCHGTQEQSTINKHNILKQASFELCRYHTYLEYLKEETRTFEDYVKTLPDKKVSSTPITQVSNEMTEAIDIIEREIEHSYHIFPIAFQAYTAYEDNYAMHILLELIKEDMMVYRDKLHQAINPVNQVVYKIVNAMGSD